MLSVMSPDEPMVAGARGTSAQCRNMLGWKPWFGKYSVQRPVLMGRLLEKTLAVDGCGLRKNGMVGVLEQELRLAVDGDRLIWSFQFLNLKLSKGITMFSYDYITRLS